MRSVHFTLLRQQDKLTGDLHPLFQGLRTYECHRCKLSCCATNIKKHVRICKGEKRVVIQTINCELCTSRFSRRDSLKIHMRTMHSIHLSTEAMKNVPAEKSYKCIFCDKGFYRRREQIYHIRTRHLVCSEKRTGRRVICITYSAVSEHTNVRMSSMQMSNENSHDIYEAYERLYRATKMQTMQKTISEYIQF